MKLINQHQLAAILEKDCVHQALFTSKDAITQAFQNLVKTVFAVEVVADSPARKHNVS